MNTTANAAARQNQVRLTLTAVTVVSVIAGVGACRRTDEGGRPKTMNLASSRVMSNTAGAPGTPGEGDAARRADRSPAGVPAAADAAPVTSAPAATATASAGKATGTGE